MYQVNINNCVFILAPTKRVAKEIRKRHLVILQGLKPKIKIKKIKD